MEVAMAVPRRPVLLAAVTAWYTMGLVVADRLRAEAAHADVLQQWIRPANLPASKPTMPVFTPILPTLSGGGAHPFIWHDGIYDMWPDTPTLRFHEDAVDEEKTPAPPQVIPTEESGSTDRVAAAINEVLVAGERAPSPQVIPAEGSGPTHWPAAWRADLSSVELLLNTPHAVMYTAFLKSGSKLSQSTIPSRVMVKEMKVNEYNPEVVLTRRKEVKALREIAIVKKFSGGDFLEYINSTTPEEWAVGVPMLLMTEAPTGTLEDVVILKSRAEVTYARRVRLLIELLRALDVFHGSGFAFRNLRADHIYIVGNCENILGPKCKLKLGDFSSAVGMPGSGEPYEQPSPDSDRVYHVYAAGHMQNWPPEMRNHEEYDPQQQDAYSVGLLMKEMMVKKRGARRLNPFRAVLGFFARRAVPVDAITKVRSVMRGLLNESPEDRLPVWEALEELEGLARRLGW